MSDPNDLHAEATRFLKSMLFEGELDVTEIARRTTLLTAALIGVLEDKSRSGKFTVTFASNSLRAFPRNALPVEGQQSLPQGKNAEALTSIKGGGGPHFELENIIGLANGGV